MRQKCESCGSTHIRSDNYGFFVCTECGLVSDQLVLQLNSRVFIKNRESNHGESQSEILIKGTTIGLSSERNRQFQKLQNLQKRSFKNPNSTSIHIFLKLKAKFDVNLDIEQFMQPFKEIYPKMPSYSKGKKIQLFCSTLFLQVCRKNLITISLKKLLAYYCLDLKSYFEVVDLIRKNNPQKKVPTNINYHIFAQQALLRINEKFKLEEQIILKAKEFIQVYGGQLGASPKNIAAVAIIVIAKLNGINLKTYKIAQTLEISSSALYSRIKVAQKFLTKSQQPKFLITKASLMPSLLPTQALKSDIKSIESPKSKILLKIDINPYQLASSVVNYLSHENPISSRNKCKSNYNSPNLRLNFDKTQFEIKSREIVLE